MHPWTGVSDEVRLGLLAEWIVPEPVDEVLTACGRLDASRVPCRAGSWSTSCLLWRCSSRTPTTMSRRTWSGLGGYGPAGPGQVVVHQGPAAATTAANTSRQRPLSTSSPMPDRPAGGLSPCPAPKPPDPTAAAVSPPDGTDTGVFTVLSSASTDTSSSRPTPGPLDSLPRGVHLRLSLLQDLRPGLQILPRPRLTLFHHPQHRRHRDLLDPQRAARCLPLPLRDHAPHTKQPLGLLVPRRTEALSGSGPGQDGAGRSGSAGCASPCLPQDREEFVPAGLIGDPGRCCSGLPASIGRVAASGARVRNID
jgi:hypothetical protein